MAGGLVVWAVALACDRSPTAVPRPPALSPSRPPQPPATKGEEPAGQPNSLHRIELMPCSSLPSESVTELIRPEGGSISVGPHTIRVPPGALASAVSITAVLDGDDGYNKVRFYPHGLQFRTPAYLTMSYANCDVGDRSRLAYVQVVYTHADNIVENEPSVRDSVAQVVTGEITHFSNFAVAW